MYEPNIATEKLSKTCEKKFLAYFLISIPPESQIHTKNYAVESCNFLLKVYIIYREGEFVFVMKFLSFNI
jgi:hypothetical protein